MTSNVPQWFIDQGLEDWAKAHNVRKEPDLESGVLEYELLAILQKALTPPIVKIYTFDNVGLSNAEQEQHKLAIRENVRWFLPYVELEFQNTKRIDLPRLEVNEAQTKLKGFTPEIGINTIIVDDRELDNLRNKNANGVNGVMYDLFNTTLIEVSTLSEDDKKFRGIVNGFAETQKHEFMHLFGKRLKFHHMDKDRTHYYDTNDDLPNLTLANMLPKLCWGRLHSKEFRDTFKI